MTGCAAEVEYSSNGIENSGVEREVITEVFRGLPFGTNVEIFMAKGHEYISTYRGGLVHSESCPNSEHETNYENR